MCEIDFTKEIEKILLNNSKHKSIIDNETIRKNLKKWMISGDEYKLKDWVFTHSKGISIDDTLMGFSISGGFVIFSKNEFCITNGKSGNPLLNKFNIEKFRDLKIERDGTSSDSVFLDGKRVGNFNRQSIDIWDSIVSDIIPHFNSCLEDWEKEKKEKNNSKSSLLIKTKLKNVYGSEKVIELYDNRLVCVNEVSEDNVEYFDGDSKFPLLEFSNMKIITDKLKRDNKPWVGLSVNKIYDDGSGGQESMSGFIFFDPTEKKKLEKIIFYFENFRNGVEIKDLDKVFLESKKSETNYIKNTLGELDKDNNGIIDLVEDKNEFHLLLKKHQKVVIEKGKEFNQNYTHQFIKVGNYLKEKRNNIQLIFDCMKQVENKEELNKFVKILEGEIHSYNLLLINSLNLIVSLIDDDQITFYDIYEKFDKLNIYNSNWENEISQKLTKLNKGISELNSNIKGLMYEIRDMGDRIVNSIEDLSYITEESTKILDNRLGEIDSSIKTNNLLTLINTYQNYKTNRKLNS